MTRVETLQVAKPILFNTEMVRAIQNGAKTATRRVIKSPAEVHECSGGLFVTRPRNYPDEYCRFEPYCPIKIGDILYVRETWRKWVGGYNYKADMSNTCQWKPSTNMPKEAARIFLQVTDVRVERLKNIITGDYRTPLNINREGLSDPCLTCTHHNGDCKDFIANNTCRLADAFADLWNSTVKKPDIDKYGWEANPWVWVIEFERLECENNV